MISKKARFIITKAAFIPSDFEKFTTTNTKGFENLGMDVIRQSGWLETKSK